MNYLLHPSPFNRTRFALNLSRAVTAGVLAVMSSSCDSYTCLDLANCASPNLDAGSSALDASSAESTTEGSATSDAELTSSPRTQTDSDPAVNSSSASSSSADEKPSNGETTEPESNGTSETTTTSVEEATGCTDLIEGCLCDDPSEKLDCWETPDGMPISDDPADAIGDCRLGKRSCVDGRWTACAGAIAPKAEDSCDRPLADDNCNGVPNEDCDCLPEEARECGTDVGPCVAGTQTCGESGQWNSECMGAVSGLPTEICTEIGDANCNGEENEGCECVGQEWEPCNDCGIRRCNARSGTWGACEPDESPRCSADGSAIEVCNAQGNWESDACVNADTAHCIAECSDSTSSPSCAVTARDADEDGYGSAACEVAPGFDCDDSTDAVRPGVAEQCDGMDNDCDGSVDLSDGLPLVGSIQSITDRSRVAVAGAGDGYFHLIGTSPTASGLFYGSINASGVSNFATTPIFTPPDQDEAYLNPQAAADGSTVGVVYTINGKGGKFVRAGVTANGLSWEAFNPTGDEQNNSQRMGDIAVRNQADFVVATARPSADVLYLATHSNSGTGSTTNDITIEGSFNAYSPHIASNGSNSGLVWQTDSPKSLNWSLVSAPLQFGPTEQLSGNAFYADVSVIDDGYGLVWVEGVGFRFMIKKPDGSTMCTSDIVPFGTVAANQELALADSANGVVVVATSPDSNLVHLYRFDDGCHLIDDTALKASPAAPTAPAIARSGTNLVIYWTEGSTGQYRLVSDLLCH